MPNNAYCRRNTIHVVFFFFFFVLSNIFLKTNSNNTSMNEETAWKCNICGMIFPTKGEVLAHHYKEHKKTSFR